MRSSSAAACRRASLARSASASASPGGSGSRAAPSEGWERTRARPIASPGDAGAPRRTALAHQLSCSTARWSAAMMSAAEVAPGSWCPIERSRGTTRGPCAPVAAPSPWPRSPLLRWQRRARPRAAHPSRVRPPGRRSRDRGRRPWSCRPAVRHRARRLLQPARSATTRSWPSSSCLSPSARPGRGGSGAPQRAARATNGGHERLARNDQDLPRAAATRPAPPAPCRPPRIRGPCSRRGRRRRSRRPAGSGSRADP